MIVKTLPLGTLEANCYYLSDGITAVLIDPGCYTADLRAFLQTANPAPSAILLTHGHFDHICGAIELCNEQKLPVYIGAADKPCLYSAKQNLAVFVGGYTREPLRTDVEVNSLVGGETLEIGTLCVKTVALAGHTAGGMGYLCENLLFCGDTVFRGNIGRTDLPGGNYPTLLNSIKRLCRLPNDTLLYSGHGEPTTLSQEKETNYYFGEI